MPSIILSHNQQFSLDRTLGCGQVFRWDRTDDGWWYGIVGERVIRIQQEGNRITFKGAPSSFIIKYFSLDMDLHPILKSIDKDPLIHTAICQCTGLRLIRQPKWECLISYICSTNSNIPMIRRRIATIAEQFGEEITFEGKTYFSFPDPSTISCSGGDAITDCKLGYRTPYVLNTACKIIDVRQWEDTTSALPYEDARKQLMKLPGVGPKAADCILLFAFQKYEAFPVDVWIRRIMQLNYLKTLKTGSSLTGKEYDIIRRFAKSHFGEYCGYAQEYLYAAREG
ncbi:MAG: 8-oxoguanine DNA glycosylase [Methanoregula sp.]|jgi:N-glycosylase/DNA lyase|nr:8-oxoguanine DNA glycosylase [Methanoregula sp.]